MAGRHRSGGSPGWRLPAMIAALVVVLLAVVGGIVTVSRDSSDGTSTLAQTQHNTSSSPSAGTSTSTSSSPGVTPTVAQAHTISPTPQPSRSATPKHSASTRSTTTSPTLSITWTQRAWVRVTDVNAGVVVLTGAFLPGYAAHWNGGRYFVELGNSGGVQVSTNGGTPYTPGPVGQIRRFTVVRG